MVHGLLSRSTEADPSGLQAPVAQGIEHSPSKRDAARSNRAGGTDDGAVERFWTHVHRGEHPKGCWLWCGPKNSNGYGTLSAGTGVSRYAHRFSFELNNGPIPAGLVIRHLCSNPPCVNPSHLASGTPADNAADAVAAGRTRRGDRSPMARLTEESVRRILLGRVNGRTQPSMALEFRVSLATIASICARRSWKHVEAPVSEPEAELAVRAQHVLRPRAFGNRSVRMRELLGLLIPSPPSVTAIRGWGKDQFDLAEAMAEREVSALAIVTPPSVRP